MIMDNQRSPAWLAPAYFIAGTFACVTLGWMLAVLVVMAQNVSDFEGGSGFAALYMFPFFFSFLMVGLVSGHFALRTHPRVRLGLVFAFILLCLPLLELL
jgi:hypothetical protein